MVNDPSMTRQAFDTPPQQTGVPLSVLSELHTRLAAVEQSQADLHAKVDAAVQSGALEPGLQEHLAHIARKHFFHDRPDMDVSPEPPRARFDAYTGERLN